MTRTLRAALLTLMVFAIDGATYAKVVDYGEAVKVATDFFRTNNMLSATSDVKEVWNSTQLSQTGVATMSATSSPAFYIFAPENSKGFVIVSADDATLPILAYSLTNEALVGNELPCGLQWWCEAMAGEIAQLRASGIDSPRKAAFNGIATLADDALYLETPAWNQGSPYNQECPLYNGSRCYTGCGPTATAEVMRWHKYPDKGIGSTDAYTTSSHKIYVESRNLEHEIDWDNMPFSYSSYTSTQATAVATLMADIGAVYTADYGTESTSISTTPSTLSRIYNHYGYSSHILFTYADTYDDDGWTALMKEQLQTCGPVLYRGTSDAGGGHLFVVDGYNANDYFHINWGWGGSSNGYFLFPSITYHINQAAVLNFVPDDGDSPECTLLVYGSGMTSSTSTFTKDQKFTMDVAGIYNDSMVDFYGDYAYALVDKEDNVKEIISSIKSRGTSALKPNYYITSFNASCTITVDMDDTDCIRLAYRDTSTSDWKLMGPRKGETVYKIYIVPIEYNVVMAAPGMSLSIDEFYEDISFTASGNVFNDSNWDIEHCYFRFAHTDSEGNIKEWLSSSSSISIDAQGYGEIADIQCNMAAEPIVGDRIRMYYQANSTDADGWELVLSESEDIPWEVELTEEMITERQYFANMYTPGLSIDTDVLYKGVWFTAETHPINVSGYAIPLANFVLVLTDSEHNVKEIISDVFSIESLPNLTTKGFNYQVCNITVDIEAGDRICMEFQANDTDEDGWTLVDSYYIEECPVEVVITEDMIASTSFTIDSTGYTTYYTNVEYTMPWGVTGTTVVGMEESAAGGNNYFLDVEWGYEAGSIVPAKTPLVLKGEPNTYELNLSYTGAAAPADNLLLGSNVETITYGPDESASYLFYELSDGEDGIGFYYGVEGGGAFTSEANRAWLALTPEEAQDVSFFGIGDDATGISSIRTGNGETDAIYTIQGLRVNDMKKKGVYIVNGRKVLVK